MLYELNLRLQEIKQNQDDFGGVSVLLFGDLMQIQPVMGQWIFDQPLCRDYEISYLSRPLWDLFTPIELQENHRQGGDKSYAELLNRVRFGNHTEDDNKVLASRIKENDYPESSLFIFGTRALVTDQNDKELNKLPEQLMEFQSVNIHSNKKNFKPTIDKRDKTVKNTSFLYILKLKKNARVMLTYNVDTMDGLTNGLTGKVIDFIYKDD